MDKPFQYSPSDRDWSEDFGFENGNYLNTCVSCEQSFKGHKRRWACKVCSTVEPQTPAAQILQRFARWHGWPEPPKPLQTFWYDVDALAEYAAELEQRVKTRDV